MDDTFFSENWKVKIEREKGDKMPCEMPCGKKRIRNWIPSGRKKKKENEFKIDCLLNHILGRIKKREWIQMRAKRDLRLGNSSGQSWWSFSSTIIPKTGFFFCPFFVERSLLENHTATHVSNSIMIWSWKPWLPI